MSDTGEGVAARKRVRDPLAYPERFKREDAAKRCRDALADALTALRAFGHEGDAKEIEDRYSLVYVDARPDVRLSMDVPPDERQVEEARRG